jgi:hypothetical protein
MFSSAMIYLVRRYRAAKTKRRVGIGRQRAGAHHNCAGFLLYLGLAWAYEADFFAMFFAAAAAIAGVEAVRRSL